MTSYIGRLAKMSCAKMSSPVQTLRTTISLPYHRSHPMNACRPECPRAPVHPKRTLLDRRVRGTESCAIGATHFGEVGSSRSGFEQALQQRLQLLPFLLGLVFLRE